MEYLPRTGFNSLKQFFYPLKLDFDIRFKNAGYFDLVDTDLLYIKYIWLILKLLIYTNFEQAFAFFGICSNIFKDEICMFSIEIRK